jgi:rsbT co-antagonist protein RsbR
MAVHDIRSAPPRAARLTGVEPVPELVAHLRGESARLRQEWLRRIDEAELLSSLGGEGVPEELASIYDHHVAVIGTGGPEALTANGRHVRERLAPRGVEAGEAVGLILLLRDVIVRSLISAHEADHAPLHRVLDAYEGRAHRIAVGVVVACLQDREQEIEMQREAVRELSAPVLQARDRLLILPVVGPVDVPRMNLLTADLLRAIRLRRARVLVLDVAGVPAIDSAVATLLVQAVDAARLLGATLILSGLTSVVAQSLVGLAVRLDRVTTVGDLQAGIEEGERLLGYRVVPVEDTSDTPAEKG